MRTVTLPNGTQVRVGLRHGYIHFGDESKRWKIPTGITTAILEHPDGRITHAQARVNRKAGDHFNKKVGRELAVSRLVGSISGLYNREERRMIFQTLCPPKSKKEEKEATK